MSASPSSEPILTDLKTVLTTALTGQTLWTPVDATRLIGKTTVEIATQFIERSMVLTPDEPTQIAVCETSPATTLLRLTWTTPALSRSPERLMGRTSSVRGSIPAMGREGTPRDTLIADTA